MKRWLRLMVCIFFVTGGATAAVAEILEDLYEARVPVADQGAEARARGASEALAIVVLKASGSSEELLQNPVIAQALPDARAKVQQYAYVREGGGDNRLLARYEFAPGYVTSLLREAGAPLWTANRPPVLLWAVVERGGQRTFLDAAATPEEGAAVIQAFSDRGLPVRLPLYDLRDSAAVSVNDVWRFDTTALQNASERYAVQDIAAARLAVTAAGQVTGDWLYMTSQSRLERTLSAASVEEFISQGAAEVATAMASRFAILATEPTGERLYLTVMDVTGYADYAAIVSWLEKLELVDAAIVDQVIENTLVLSLRAQTDASQLASLLDLNSRLERVPSADPARPLLYRWLPDALAR